MSAHTQNGSADNIPFSVSRFTTAFPDGPAYGIEEATTWPAFTALIRRRRQGAKDGPNFIPATFRLEPNGQVRRLAVNLVMRTAIVLDIETSKLTGEVPSPFAEAAARIKAQGWTAAVYTSHNHTPAAPRYRIVLPLSAEIAPELPAVEVVAELLGMRGVLDESKIAAASLFYLPSADPEHVVHHETTVIDGAPIDAAWMQDRAGAVFAAREAERARQHAEALEAVAKRRDEKIRQGFDPNASIIEAIRDRLDLDGVLVGHGYQPAGDKRYLYPGSESGVPGVYVLTGRDGIERVYSHHSGDPLAPGNLPPWCRVKALDIVDVVTILEFGSDQKAALRTMATRFGIGDQRTARPEPSDESVDRAAFEEAHGSAKSETTPSGKGKDGNARWPPLDTSIATRDLLPAPVLPLAEVFSSAWAAWIARAAETKGAPAGYVATALLSVAGSLIGNARWSQPWEEWAEPPVIFAGLVGLPSTNKSPALDALVQPVMEIEAGHNEDLQERRRDHTRDAVAAQVRREGWEKAVKAAVGKGEPPPKMPTDAAEPDPVQRRRIASTDPTVAKAERLSAANPRGLILQRDELAGWIAGLDRYSGGGDRQFWLQAYGGRPWTPDRVKDGDQEIAVPHLTWGIVGGIQPDRLASLLLAGDDDGLAARFIYCWPDAATPKRPSAGRGLDEAQEWLKRLRELPWTPPAPKLIPFS